LLTTRLSAWTRLSAQALKVGVELMPLIFSKALHVTNITRDEPQVSLVRPASGKWNFSSLGHLRQSPGTQPQPPQHHQTLIFPSANCPSRMVA